MIQRLKLKSEFSKNVLTLMTGTTISQAIPIAISPILSRIYTPEDFGFLAMYLFAISTISTIVTGKYEMAIYLPKSKVLAKRILELSLVLIVSCCSLIFFVVLLGGSYIQKNYLQDWSLVWLYLFPFGVFISASYLSINHFLVRESYFKTLSFNRVMQSTSNALLSIGLGIASFVSGGLVIASVASQVIVSLLLFKKIKIRIKTKRQFLKFKILAKKYNNFPKHMLASQMLNSFSSNMPILVLTTNYGLTFSGYYTFVEKVLGLPLTLIGNSFSEIFRQEASKSYSNTRKCDQVFIGTFKKLVLFSIIPFTFFYFSSPFLFSFIFGEEWGIAGEYAQILTPMFFFKFITMPVSSVILLANRTVIDFWWQVAFLIASLVGYFLDVSAINLIKYLSAAFSCMYLLSFYINYKIAKYGDDAF